MGTLSSEGGKPVRENFLPFSMPSIGSEEEKEVISTLRSGWIGRGKKTEEFEKLFANYCNVKYALGVNSCTAALHLALLSANVCKNDEVITTSLTFPATINPILHAGAKPIFVDVEKETLNIDVEKIEEKITKKTKAIIPVHLYGNPCEMDKMLKIARKYNLIIIEDAAHAIGAEYHGKKIGSIGDFTAFSFYPTKNITTGEGGMLTSNNKKAIEKARILSLHGISKDAWKRYKENEYIDWKAIYAGYKYNMYDMQASLGIQQLKKIEQFWKRRKEIVESYNEFFNEIPEIFIPSKTERCKPAYHLYPVIFKIEKLRADRNRIIRAMYAENIGVGIHFKALHLEKYSKEFGFAEGILPNAEYASNRLISLPLYPKMNEKDIEDVKKAVTKIIERYRK